MIDNEFSVMRVIDVRGKSVPAGWTSHSSGNIASRRCRWKDYELLRETDYPTVQISIWKKTNGTSPVSDRLDGNDCYSMQAVQDPQNGYHLLIGKCNESGAADAKILDYVEVVGSSPSIEDWSDKLKLVPLEGVRTPDALPTPQMLSDADGLGTEDVPLSSPSP